MPHILFAIKHVHFDNHETPLLSVHLETLMKPQQQKKKRKENEIETWLEVCTDFNLLSEQRSYTVCETNHI